MSNSGKVKPKNKDGKKRSHKSEPPKLTELENQVVLRMPEPYASTLREALQNGSIKDRLQIDFEPDVRHATVKFDGVVFAAKLTNLPCIVESWKTFDKKSLWKTADICQILVCRNPEGPDSSTDEDENATADHFKKHLQEAKKYRYPHGLTPPLKNVRKRRFRKTAKQKYVDAPEIEKEVKRLLRADISAVDVKFDIINDELEKQKQEDPDDDIDVGGPTLEHFNENSNMSSMLSSDNETGPNEADILPDISSSDNEDNPIPKTGKDIQSVSNSNKSLQDEHDKRLMDIRTKKLEQELRVRNASNPHLKERFQAVLDQIIQQEVDIIMGL